MNRPSTKPWSPPELERLLLDGDVNAYLERYLTAIGFDVLFATRVDVDIHDDTAILKWARRRGRIMVCHDKFRDGQTRMSLFREVYENGGHIIRIGGRPDQPPLTSLGKITVHRQDWLDFFSENDGIVLVHMTGMTRMPREYLLRRYQSTLFDPSAVLRQPRRQTQATPRHKPSPDEQGELPLGDDAPSQD
jgi:hypothetical protein